MPQTLKGNVMKRSHKILFENLLQEEYNRGYDDCRKAVRQSLQIKTQEGGTRRAPTPKGQTRHNLISLMRAHPSSKNVAGWTEFINRTHNSNLSEGAISGALSRMKREGLVVLSEFGWHVSIQPNDEIPF